MAIPNGMKLTSTPKDAKIVSPFGSYEQTTTTEGSKVTVRSKLTFASARVLPSEYNAFRAFCQSVDASSGARLVVAKK